MSKKQLHKIENKTILITGGAGFIGSHLCEKFVENNKIVVYDNFRRNALQYTAIQSHKNLTLIQGDILDGNKVQNIFRTYSIDCVLHLAAIAGVSSYYKNPLETLSVDVWGTYHILNFSAEYGIKHVVLFSSSEVYGVEASNATEESPTIQGPATDSRWSYSVGKLAGDHFAFAFSKIKKLPITIIRPFNIYGPRQVGEGAISNFVLSAVQNKPLIVRGNGKQRRAWCYIDDLVDGVIKIISCNNSHNEIFNLGNPREIVTVTQLAKKILHRANSKSNIMYKEHLFTDITNRSPNIKKAEALLSYRPKVMLNEGLKKTINWFEIYEKTGH